MAAPLDPLTIEGLEANVRDEDLRCPWVKSQCLGSMGGGCAPAHRHKRAAVAVLGGDRRPAWCQANKAGFMVLGRADGARTKQRGGC